MRREEMMGWNPNPQVAAARDFGKRPGLGKRRSPKPDPLGGKMTITSFDELNLLSPGLGDNQGLVYGLVAEYASDE